MSYPGSEQTCKFRGKSYIFVGDPSIECKCLSNGMKCSQQGLREVDKECFIGKMDKEGFLCTRVWKEIKP